MNSQIYEIANKINNDYLTEKIDSQIDKIDDLIDECCKDFNCYKYNQCNYSITDKFECIICKHRDIE